MLPPVLEIFVIWHPEDPDGQSIAEELVAHFRSVSFSGVVGGGVHVSLRSAGWHEEGQAPRPVYTHRTPGPSGMQPAEYIAIVPLMGIRMAEAVEKGGSWQDYFEGLIAEQQEEPERIQVLPYLLDRQATNQTRLGDLLGPYQMIATEDPARTGDTYKALRCRPEFR